MRASRQDRFAEDRAARDRAARDRAAEDRAARDRAARDREDRLRFPVSSRVRDARVDRPRVRAVLRTCLEGEGGHPRASIGLLFCGDRTMRQLNRDFRGKDRTTDVLSFPSGEDLESGGPESAGRPFLGDIAVSLPQCLRQAEERGVKPGEELLRLLVHGVLHLVGYDHVHSADRQRMVPRERLLRARCGRLGLGPELVRIRASK